MAAPEYHDENGAADPVNWTEPFMPSKEDVLEVPAKALEGMSQQQVVRLTEVIKATNLSFEHKYLLSV